MTRSRRGNLLLSALFMAAFLFFLSVAIVVTNREDIRSTLLADHKMRAEFAADGTLDRNIQLMRSTPDWEAALNNPISFASGATVQSSVRRLSASMLSLDVQATSNLVRADRHWVLEEFRLADSLAAGNTKPHLFAMQGSGWSVLGPNFKWQTLGSLSSEVLPHTFAAGGGPVFYLVRDEIDPPVIQDFTVASVGFNIHNNAGFGPTGATLPRGHGPYVVELKDDKFTPVKVTDPGDAKMLGRIRQPTINGQENGTPTFATVTINGTPTTIDTSLYQGPILETYLLTGTAAVAVDNAYYCHALHVYYRGFKFQNDASGGQGTFVMPVGPLQEPAILKYDGKAWSKVVDLLKVPDDQTQPEILGGPRPDPNYLWVTGGGTVYAREAGGANLLTVSGNQFAAGSAIQGDLFTYQEALVSVTKDATTGLTRLSQYDPALTLPKSVPGRNLGAQPFRANGMVVTLKEEKALDLRYSTKASPVATAKQDLFALVTCQGVIPGQQAPQSSVQLLAHYDGKNWQFLPNGMADALPNSSYFLESQRDYGGKAQDLGGAVALALAGYASNQPLLRRYSPRFHN